MPITDFVCWCAAVSAGAAFILSLSVKWGVLEWLQVHAPSDLLYRLFSCRFCVSWWTNVAICVSLCVAMRDPLMLAAAPCSTMLTISLWSR